MSSAPGHQKPGRDVGNGQRAQHDGGFSNGGTPIAGRFKNEKAYENC